MTVSLSLAAEESPFYAGDSYFTQVEGINPSDSHADDDGSQMLKTVRGLLQTSDLPNKIQGRILQTHPSGEGSEELVWTRSTIVHSVGAVMCRRWSFDDLDEEIQAVCWARFEEKGTARAQPAETQPLDRVLETDLWKDSSCESVFGPYGRVMRASASKVGSSAKTIANHDYHGHGTGFLVRALCVFFRSFAYLYGGDGSEYRIDLPICPRRAWPLFPVGVLLERRTPVEITSWNRPIYEHNATFYSLAAPLHSIVPVGIAHRILHSSLGLPAVYQDDKDVPNVDIFTNSEFKSFEHVLFVEESTPESHRVLFTIERGLWIHCYLYAYRAPSDPTSQHLMKGLLPEVDSGGVGMDTFPIPSPEFKPVFTDHASSVSTTTTESMDILSQLDSFKQTPSWLKEATPPPPNWRDNYLQSTPLVNAESVPPPPDFLSSNEEDPNDFDQPVHWFQKLDTCLVEQESDQYEAIKVVTFDDSQLSRSFAIWLPAERAYRLARIRRTSWKMDRPKAGQVTIADFAKAAYPALAIEKVRATRSDAYDLLVLKPDHTLSLYADDQEYQLMLSVDLSVKMGSHVEDTLGVVDMSMSMDEGHHISLTESQLQLLNIKDGVGSFFTTVFEDGQERRVSIDLLPHNRLVNDVLATLQYVLPTSQFAELRRNQLVRWCSKSRPTKLKEEIACLWEPLLEMMVGEEPGIIRTQPQQETSVFDSLASSAVHQKFSNDRSLFNLRVPTAKAVSVAERSSQGVSLFCAPTLYALHVLGQSLKVDLTRQAELEYLVPTLLKIGNRIAPEWSDYWSRIFPDAERAWSSVPLAPQLHHLLPELPPDFIVYCLAPTELKQDWHNLVDLPAHFGLQPSLAYGRNRPLPCSNLNDIFDFISLVLPNDRITRRTPAEQLLLEMVKRNWTAESLDSLPLCLAMPLRENLRLCQLYPEPTYPLEAYGIIDRMDMFESVKGGIKPPSQFDAIPARVGEQERTFDQLYLYGQFAANGLAPDVVDAGSLVQDDFTEIRWAKDRRLEEVSLMLSSSRVPVVKPVYPGPNVDIEKEHQALVLRICERTLSLAPGRAIFTYGCVTSIAPEAFAIPKVTLAVHVMPMGLKMELESTKLTPESKWWSDFHNGCAAALRISPSSESVQSSWIQFVKPTELNPEHAGFLFGLGLNGHLKTVDTWDTFSYLSPKHEQTSIAVLLGLAASNVGSSSDYVTRLIAVHTPALLPVRTVDINVPLLVQAAGLTALGMVYLGTGSRKMADDMLAEIARDDIMLPSQAEHRESYTISAGFAFGMIMVGRGGNNTSPADARRLARLKLLIHGPRSEAERAELSRNFDSNITAPGASMALAMLYLKSNRADVADIVSIPTTRDALNSVSPNLLLLRTIAKCLIMWDSIKPSLEWVNVQYIAMKQLMPSSEDGTTANLVDVAAYNIIAGACFAMALKYAGTASTDAWPVIVHYYDILVRSAYAAGRNVDHSVRRQAARDAINALSSAMAIIMAGTGDLDCLQRLRHAHGKYTLPSKFGMHLANHMSLGMLFLGGGRYTLGTSHAAVCALLISFYPRYPLFGYDNRTHLQALRHLWVLAVEPRCLITRDVSTRKIVSQPVTIHLKGADEQIRKKMMLAPTLMPDFDVIRDFRIDNSRYWGMTLAYDKFPHIKETFIRNQTLWVQKRRGFLSYNVDASGTETNIVRASTGVLADVVCLERPVLLDDANGESSKDFTRFMTALSSEPRFAAFADLLCRNHDWENYPGDEAQKVWVAFCQAALADCIGDNKPQILSAYLSLQAIRSQQPHEGSFFTLALTDLNFLTFWYQSTNIARAEYLPLSVIRSVRTAVDDKLDALRADSHFLPHLRSYSEGRGLDPDRRLEMRERRIVGRQLAFYLTATNTPSASTLMIAKRVFLESLDTALEKNIRGPAVLTGTKLLMRETLESIFNSYWQWRALSDTLDWWAASRF